MKSLFGRIVFGLVMLGFPFGIISCLNGDGAEDPSATFQKEVQAIDDYLTANNINAIKDVNGIRMAITKLGTGLPAILSSKVDVDYIGKVFGSTAVFDEGNTKGLVSGYIAGWQMALTTLPAGSKATLYIPSYWGYKNVAQPGIPANSTLVFNIAINDVIETSTEVDRFKADTTAIAQYLTDKGITAVKDTTGISYVITEAGTGPIPGWYDKVKISFKFTLLTDDTKVVYNGTQEPVDGFDSRVIDFIHAFKIGLQKLPEGSKATIYAPSGLAFGPDEQKQNGLLIIPANSNLIIDVELTDVVQP